MIASDQRNGLVLFPYLTGEDLNSTAAGEASRWAVDFTGMDLAQAATFTEPMARLQEQARPYRLTLTNKPKLQTQWWLYERPGPAMRRAIQDLNELLVVALVSKTVMPMRVPCGQVFSHALGVFATDSFAQQAILSSSLHQAWAIKYGSGMRNDPRYTPSDVFETFPRPLEAPELDVIGRILDTERREIMLRRDLGLTKLYNLVNDPTLPSAADADVARVREIHVDLDHAVMAAYGWDDVPLNHGFHTYRQMTRWTVCPEARVEILDRLLEENHRRAALQGEAVPEAEHDEGDDM